ncbi:hypothetical protein ACQWFX_24960, partial [Salmonella enterica subsp. enterica serovar Infantis]
GVGFRLRVVFWFGVSFGRLWVVFWVVVVVVGVVLGVVYGFFVLGGFYVFINLRCFFYVWFGGSRGVMFTVYGFLGVP